MDCRPEIRRGILISAVAGAFAASGLANASNPPTPPSVPTAPVMPAFQQMIMPAYGDGTTESYGVAQSPPTVPAEFGAGGYSTIKDPSSLAGYSSVSVTASGNSSTGAVVGPNSCTTAVIEHSSLTATGNPGDPLWISTDSTQTVTVPVLGNSTLGALVEQTINDPIEITQAITVADGSSNFATGSYSSYYDALNGTTPTVFQKGLFAVGGGGYAWLKIASGGTLTTTGTFAMATSGPSGGTFVGSPYGLKNNIASYTSPPGSSATYLNFGGKTNYGVVNVAGGTWNASNSPIFVGFGGAGFITNNGGTINLNSTSLLLGEGTSLGGAAGVVVLKGGKLASTGTGGYVIVGAGGALASYSNGLYLTQGATAAVSSAVVVGDGTSGSLILESAGSLQSASAYAGGAAAGLKGPIQQNFIGGSGTVVIDGVSSVWNISGNADFGVSGGANVTVQNHGDLSVGGTLTLGDQSTGNGTLTVQADGSVESGDATLGNQAGATGFANVSNINTLWTVDGDLTIGDSGQGTLTLSNNGEVITTGDAILGSQAGSTGTATITDAGTEWQINGELKVGDNGTGTMQVENGGYVSLAGNLAIADSGGTSTLTLDGNGSRLIVSGTSVTIGGKGQGTLTVQNAGAAIFSGASVSLGESSGSAGTLTVQDANTIMSTGSLTVGSQGTGTLNLLNTASLTTDNSFTLGEDASGVGTATIDNSSMTDTSTLTVGGSGSGTLNIQNDGSLTVQGNDVTLGEQAGSNGILNLTGNGSTLTFNGDVTVGKSGTGVFSVASDAHFSGTSMTLASGTGFGGSSTGGSGSLDISGGSSVILSQDITIGKYGTGSIALAGSSFLSSQGDVTLGSQPGTQGTAVVDSGSSWSTAGSFTIGSQGSGTVTIKGGSSLMADGDALTIGKGGGAGTLTATDQSTQVQYAGDLIIGKESDGTFNIQNGAVAQATASGTGDVYLAETSGINGNLNIDGSTSSLSAANMVVGGTSSKSGGDGVVNLTGGGQMTVAKALTMWKNGSLNLAGSNYSGSITIGTGKTATAGNIEINSNGQLAASGSIIGNVLNGGGTVAVGNGQPGTLKITGDFSQTGGITKVSVFGISSGQFSQLDATGNVSFSGGTVEFDFGNGFAPLKGQTFQFIDPPQSVDVNGLTYSFTGLAPGFDFTVTPDTNGLLFTALNNGIATTTATPEPASLGLLTIGVGLLLLQRRSRR